MSERRRSIPSFPVLRRSRRDARRGFSFVEIMFAVMILGIGFILVAGIFPVALNQTQANGDETNSASMAKEAVAYLSTVPNTATLMAADDKVHRFGPGGTTNALGPDGDLLLWQSVQGNLILAEDARYAWVPFYRRNNIVAGTAATPQPANSAQIILIGVRVRNHSAYDPNMDLAFSGAGAGARATLMGRPLTVTLQAGADEATADTIDISGGDTGAVSAGAYVIIADDPRATLTNPPANPPVQGTGTAVGWVLKVGNLLSGSKWQLQPGGDMKNSIYKPSGTLSAWVVGAGADNTGAFTGGPQDIMAYSTFIPLR